VESTTLAPPLEEAPAKTGVNLFEDHFDAVFRFISRRMDNVDDAKDVAAETFAAALSQKPPRKANLRCWLYGIARRKLADAYRKRRRHEPLNPAQTDGKDLAEAVAVRRAVEALPPNQRDAFLLQTLEDLSVEEIAQVMGRSRSSAKALLQRARETLRRDYGLTASEESTQ
jgi:RNA polymerase sigma factor (sigma-70 family)